MGTNGITKTRHTIGIHWDKEQRIRTARVAVEGHLRKNPKIGGKSWEVWKNWWKIWSQNPGKSEKNVLIWHKTVSLKLKRCVDWKSWSRRSENPTQSRKKGSQPKSSSHKKRGFVHMIYIYYRYILCIHVGSGFLEFYCNCNALTTWVISHLVPNVHPKWDCWAEEKELSDSWGMDPSARIYPW